MKVVFLSLLFLIEPAAGRLEIPRPPAKGVYDPAGWLEPVKRAELEANHLNAFEKWGIRVFVLILPERPPSGVEDFSNETGRSWGGPGTWGVLIHVIEDPESPWCFGERGESLRWTKREEFERVLASARSRANREPDPALSVMVGTRELTDELGFLGIVSKRRYQMSGKVHGDGTDPEASSARDRRLFDLALTVGLPLLALLSLMAIFLILRKSKSPAKGFEFPETAPRPRFGGPWSGGGNVLVEFRDHEPR